MTAGDPSSLVYVRRFQEGDARAFEDLCRRYSGSLRRYLRLTLSDPHEAEDVAQDVFLAVYQALPRYEIRPGIPFAAWLFAIARRQVLRAHRRRARAEIVTVDIDELDARNGIAPAGQDLLAARWLTSSDVEEAIRGLPERQFRVVVLRLILGLDGAEAAGLMGTSPAAVYEIQRRALATLRRRLIALGYGPSETRGLRSPMWIRPWSQRVVYQRGCY